MRRHLNSLVIAVVGLLAAAGLGFAYEFGVMGTSSALSLGILAVALCVTVAVFLRKMNHPDSSVEEMLYKTDHPTRT
jgi:hypothetical protein